MKRYILFLFLLVVGVGLVITSCNKDNGPSAINETVPKVPTLSSPTNNAINVTTSPTFSWNESTGASSYILRISNDRFSPGNVFLEDVGKTTTKQVNGLSFLTTYYWQVSARNNFGISDKSNTFEFTTVPSPLAPETPVLLTPANGAINVATSPTFSWNASTGASNYILQISYDSLFSFSEFDEDVGNNTNQQVKGLSYSTSTYYWRVSATNSFGNSNWSTPWSFTKVSDNYSSCSGTPTVIYGGKTYNTVQIGYQCWLKENLDVGTMIQANQNATNNSVIEKYCYDNDENNCAKYGGLYQWNEAMQYETIPGTQGICPSGWHIPTKEDLATLQRTLNNSRDALLAKGESSGTNTSGFSALLAGYNRFGSFYRLGISTYFWGSLQFYGDHAYSMGLLSYISMTGNESKHTGFSVRCVKD